MQSRQTWMIFIGIWLGVSGCGGGPAVQAPPQQLVTQVDSQAKQNRLQEQLVKQVAQLSMVDFKDYKVGPEDLLEIAFLDTDKLRSETRVNGQGEISLLLVGVVPVGGLTTNEVEKKLAQLYKAGDYLQNPQIRVAVKEFRHKRVAVTGSVNKPDFYALIGPRTLLEVLSMAGGLTDKAGETAHIIRSSKGSASQTGSPRQSFAPGTETIIVDLNRLLLKGAVELNHRIQNGDVVHVPPAQIAHVLGAVNKPGEIFLKNNMTLTKAVAQAGGLHIVLSSYSATILRQDENGQRQTLTANISKITKGTEVDLPLKDSDIVFVHESGIRRFLFDFKTFTPGNVGMGIPGML